MNLNDSQARIKEICEILRELDPYYKPWLLESTSIMLRVSLLVFLKERCISEDHTLILSGEGYKSYLLKEIWSQVMAFCSESEEKKELYFTSYKKLESLNPTSKESVIILDDIIGDLDRGKHDDVESPSDELSELSVKLLNYKGGIVYNPNAGDGSLGRYLNIGDNYFGATKSPVVWSIGIARMLLQDMLPSNNYVWSPLKSLELSTYDRYINVFFEKEFDYDEIFSKLTHDGRSVIVIKENELFYRRNDINEKLIKANVLDKVIFLPTSTLNWSMIGMAILVCQKGRSDQAPVTILDASGEEYYTKSRERRRHSLNISKILYDLEDTNADNRIEVSTDSIVDEQYNLSPWVYIKSSKVLPDGYERAAVRNLTKGIPRDAGPLAKDVIMIRTSHLESNQTDFHLDRSTILMGNESKRDEGRVLTKSCLLVATRPGQVFSAYYRYTPGDQFYPAPGFMVLEVDESRIYPEYLVYKLRSINVKGSSALNRSYIWTYQIEFPSLAEQRKIIEDIVNANRLVKVRELGLTQEIIRLKNEYKAKIRTKKHNLGSLKTDITADIEIINKLIQRALSSGDLNLILLEKCLSRMKNNWETLDHRLCNIDAENVFGPESEFDFDSYLKNYCATNQHKKYKLRYEVDIHSFDEINAQKLILVNPDDFKQVVENIISNAEKHGFNEGRNDYEIIISASCDISSEMVVFEFKNNGTPAPAMTAEQFALPGWRTPINGSEGDGNGGAYISEMTRNFKGGFTPPTTIESKSGNMETTITIFFPTMIKFDDNE